MITETKKININFWSGANSFDMQKELTLWKKRFIAKYSNLNIIEINQDNLKNHPLTQLLLSEGLFGSTKLIIYKNIFSGEEIAPYTNDLIIKISAVPANIFIIFYQTEIVKNKILLSALEKLTATAIQKKEFSLPATLSAIINWSIKYCGHQKITATNKIWQKIIEDSGALTDSSWSQPPKINLPLLASELDKLIAYLYPATEITESAVEALINKVESYQIWTLLNTLMSGKPNQATLALEKHLNTLPKSKHQKELRFLLSLWAEQIKKLILAKTADSGEDLVKKFSWTPKQSYALHKQTSNYSKEELLVWEMKLIDLFKISLNEPKLLKARLFTYLV